MSEAPARPLPRPLPELPAWNLGLTVLGLLPLGAAALFAPGPGETVLFRGEPWGGPCTFLATTGMPCTTCGMTRSWVHLAAGHPLEALAYNPAGAVLFAWLSALGLLGLARLVLPAARRLRASWQLMVGWILSWILGLYLGGWLLRLAGLNALPGG